MSRVEPPLVCLDNGPCKKYRTNGYSWNCEFDPYGMWIPLGSTTGALCPYRAQMSPDIEIKSIDYDSSNHDSPCNVEINLYTGTEGKYGWYEISTESYDVVWGDGIQEYYEADSIAVGGKFKTLSHTFYKITDENQLFNVSITVNFAKRYNAFWNFNKDGSPSYFSQIRYELMSEIIVIPITIRGNKYTPLLNPIPIQVIPYTVIYNVPTQVKIKGIKFGYAINYIFYSLEQYVSGARSISGTSIVTVSSEPLPGLLPGEITYECTTGYLYFQPGWLFCGPGRYGLSISSVSADGYETSYTDFSGIAMEVVVRDPSTESVLPYADFTASIQSGIAPLTVSFRDTSFCGIVNYTEVAYKSVAWWWTFYDGSTSSEQNPTHTFNLVGNKKTRTFTVMLTVTFEILEHPGFPAFQISRTLKNDDYITVKYSNDTPDEPEEVRTINTITCTFTIPQNTPPGSYSLCIDNRVVPGLITIS